MIELQHLINTERLSRRRTKSVYCLVVVVPEERKENRGGEQKMKLVVTILGAVIGKHVRKQSSAC